MIWLYLYLYSALLLSLCFCTYFGSKIDHMKAIILILGLYLYIIWKGSKKWSWKNRLSKVNEYSFFLPFFRLHLLRTFQIISWFLFDSPLKLKCDSNKNLFLRVRIFWCDYILFLEVHVLKRIKKVCKKKLIERHYIIFIFFKESLENRGLEINKILVSGAPYSLHTRFHTRSYKYNKMYNKHVDGYIQHTHHRSKPMLV